jgi:predicted RNase H-like nuclease
MAVAGVDGCKGNWLAVRIDDGARLSWNLFPTLTKLLDEWHDLWLVLVDVPIGLRSACDSASQRGPRRCDVDARRLLGRPRSSSVFPAPCREAIYAPDFAKAQALDRVVTGRSLSAQTWNIVRYIREADALLRSSESARRLIRETHPEVCFWALNRGDPLKHSKATAEGVRERLAVLGACGIDAAAVLRDVRGRIRAKTMVGDDDVLDALAAAVTALDPNSLAPQPPETDAVGLPMEIVYRRLR